MAAQPTTNTKQSKPTLTITTHPYITALGAPTIPGLGEPYVSAAAAKWEREQGCTAVYHPAVHFAHYAFCGANVDANGIPKTFWEPEKKKTVQPPVGTKAQDPEAKGEGEGKGTIPFPKYDEAVAFREAVSQQFPWLLSCACSPCCKRK